MLLSEVEPLYEWLPFAFRQREDKSSVTRNLTKMAQTELDLALKDKYFNV